MLWGITFFALSLSWISGLTFPGYITLVLYLSLYPSIFGSILSWFQKEGAVKILFIPSLWVVLEYIYGHLLTGFPWLYLGISQVNNLPFLQIASFGGAYLLSWIIILFNTVLAQFFIVISHQKEVHQSTRAPVTSKEQKIRIKNSPWFFKGFTGAPVTGARVHFSDYCLLTTVVIILILHLYGFYKMKKTLPQDNNHLKVTLVQGNIPSLQRWREEMKEENLSRYLELTHLRCEPNKPDLIIWPETAVPAYFPEDNAYKKIAKLVKEEKTYLLTGGLEVENDKAYNIALLFSPEGYIQKYRKIHLVPFGEFIPGGKIRPWKRLVVKLSGFDPSFSRGENRSPLSAKGNAFGVAICYEDIFPEEVNAYFKKGAKFLTVITNDSWFGGKGSEQHLAIGILRAVENGSYIIRCANTGVSCLISPEGRILKKKDLFTAGHLDVSFPVFIASTFYKSFPFFFPIIFLLLVAGSLVNRVK